VADWMEQHLRVGPTSEGGPRRRQKRKRSAES
jgi:hypothetical protein